MDSSGNSKHDTSPQAPSSHGLAEIARDIGLDLTDSEIQEYRDAISESMSSFEWIYNAVEPRLPVKYPRTSGYRPRDKENPLNAWYWRCDIHGAQNGPLNGKTIAIKDSIPVAGVPMMIGSRILEGYVPDIDATVVTRVLDAGGCIKGKATCENFCCSDVSITSATGPVLNPLNKEVMAGGSSSGCAALIAAGEVDMAIGGDQGGSIRTPAAFCGIVGLKPTFGLVPYTGIASLDTTIDHAGPMAKDVWHTALLLEAIAGGDGDMDPRQPCNLTVPPYTKLLSGDVKGIKIGLVKEGFIYADSSVANIVRDAACMWKQVGATVKDVSIPWHSHGATLGDIIFPEGVGRATFDDNGTCYGSSAYCDTNLQTAIARGLKTHPNQLTREIKFIRLISRYMREQHHGVLYGKAQNLRRELTKAYDEALKNVDVLVMPTCPNTATPFPEEDVPLKEYLKLCFLPKPNTAQFGLSGHPSLSINAGFSNGLPVGMMITGRKFDDLMVLNVAYAFEKLRDSAMKTN